MGTTNHPDYEVVRVEEDRVFIVDLNLGHISVTNDARFVFQEIKNNFPGKRVIYRDTLGDWDEIIENDVWGIKYAFYSGHVPENSEITGCPTSALIRKN